MFFQCHGDAKSQSISSCAIDPICFEYSGFSTRKVRVCTRFCDTCTLSWFGWIVILSIFHGTQSGIIMCRCPVNERRRYNVTSSLIGWAHSQNDPCSVKYFFKVCFTVSNHNSGLEQDCSISSVSTVEILQSCTNSSIWMYVVEANLKNKDKFYWYLYTTKREPWA